MNKAILFDFDGVFVDSFNFSYELNRDHLDNTLTPDGYRERFEGNIYAHKGTDQTFDWWSHYIPKLMEAEIIKGWDEVLKELSKNYILFIVSGTTSEPIKTFLTNYKLLEYFAGVYGSDVEKSKVKKINNILTQHSLDPKDCVFITDTSGDVKEARECGVSSIAVSWGYHPVETLLASKPMAIVEKPNDLLQILKV